MNDILDDHLFGEEASDADHVPASEQPLSDEMRKKMERSSSLCLFLAKFFLAAGSILGWLLTIVGDTAFAVLAWKDKLKVLVVAQVGCVALCVYGIWKWYNGITELTDIDYGVMILTGIGTFYVAWMQLQEKSEMLGLEVLGSVLAILCYYLLGIGEQWDINGLDGMTVAWICMTICHLVYYEIGRRKKYRFFMWLQILSAMVAFGRTVWPYVLLYRGYRNRFADFAKRFFR